MLVNALLGRFTDFRNSKHHEENVDKAIKITLRGYYALLTFEDTLPNSFGAPPAIIEFYGTKVSAMQSCSTASKEIQVDAKTLHFFLRVLESKSTTSMLLELPSFGSPSNVFDFETQELVYGYQLHDAAESHSMEYLSLRMNVVDGTEMTIPALLQGHLGYIVESVNLIQSVLSQRTSSIRDGVRNMSFFSRDVDVSDPVFLSRPSNIWRMRSKSYQSTDDWKVVMRLVQCATIIDSGQYNSMMHRNMKTGALADYELVTTSLKEWHHWELGALTDCEILKEIYFEKVKRAQVLQRFYCDLQMTTFLIEGRDRNSLRITDIVAALTLDTVKSVSYNASIGCLEINATPLFSKVVYRYAAGVESIKEVVADAIPIHSNSSSVVFKEGTLSINEFYFHAHDDGQPVAVGHISALCYHKVGSIPEFVSPVKQLKTSHFLQTDNIKLNVKDDGSDVLVAHVVDFTAAFSDFADSLQKKSLVVSVGGVAVEIPSTILV